MVHVERSGNKLLVIVKKMRLVLFQVVFDDFVLRRDIPSLKQSHGPFMGLSNITGSGCKETESKALIWMCYIYGGNLQAVLMFFSAVFVPDQHFLPCFVFIWIPKMHISSLIFILFNNNFHTWIKHFLCHLLVLLPQLLLFLKSTSFPVVRTKTTEARTLPRAWRCRKRTGSPQKTEMMDRCRNVRGLPPSLSLSALEQHAEPPSGSS